MDHRAAEEYAKGWIEAWNTHNVDALVDHYTDDVVFHSPFVQRLTGDESGVIHGKEALRAYFRKGMDAYPHMRFQLHKVGVGVGSIVLNYISVENNLASELHVLDGDGKATEVRCHYSSGI